MYPFFYRDGIQDNFLFYTTRKGITGKISAYNVARFLNTYEKDAKASARIYSIIETAKANNLVVEKYLTYLFDMLSKLDVKSKEQLLGVMP